MAEFDGVHMLPTETGDAMRRLGTAGRDLAQAWSTARSNISSFEGQLGQGQFGQAFMARYRAGADHAVAAADKWVIAPGDLAHAGQDSVEIYVAADGNAARDLRSLL